MVASTAFSCRIDTTDPAAELGMEIWLDHNKIFDVDPVTGAVDVDHEFSDQDQDHELRFVLKNKRPEHTKIDEHGNIVSDALLIIKNFRFEQIESGTLLTDLSVYAHDFNGHGPETQQKFFGEMGCNGTVTLRFSTPMYQWLLEHL